MNCVVQRRVTKQVVKKYRTNYNKSCLDFVPNRWARSCCFIYCDGVYGEDAITLSLGSILGYPMLLGSMEAEAFNGPL